MRPVLLAAALLACAPLLGACERSETPPTDTPSPGTPDGGGSDAGENPAPPTAEERTRVHHYLHASPFSRLELELDAVTGKAPRAASVSFIESALARVVAKPAGVAVVFDQQNLVGKGADGVWTFAELQALVPQIFGGPFLGSTLRMHVLFLDGQYENPNVLGIAWAGQHLALFTDVIERYCKQDPTNLLGDQVCIAAEQGVWLHEAGHLLGLVNNGLPMAQPHDDATHPAHDANEQCVMYWAFAAPDGITLLSKRLQGSSSAKLEFDDACLADLAQGRSAP
jgi:hypothetical protein